MPNSDPHAPPTAPERGPGSSLGRLVPLLVVLAVAVTIVAMGWHHKLSPEALIRHRAEIDGFVAAHGTAAVASFAGIYATAVALSLPGAVFLTIAGGILFGTVLGGAAAVVAATVGATLLFLIARSALGDWLMRRAGATAERLAAGFRRDAFNYILFLRLVPVFPFWLVNLVPALSGVKLLPFVLATAIGIVPGTIAFAFLGAGLDSGIAAQAAAYRTCLAAGQGDCRVEFDLKTAITPELIAALVGLGLLALVPVVLRRLKLTPERPSP